VTRRASRTLIGLLSVTTVVGLSAYAIAHHKSAAPAVAEKHAGAAAPTLLAAQPTQVAPAATQPSKAPITLGSPAGQNLAPKLVATADTKSTPEAKPASAVQPAISAKGVIAQGKAKLDAGDLLAGRKILNDALLSGTLSDEDANAAKKLMAEANKEIVFSTKRFSEDPWQSTHRVAPGERLGKIAFNASLTPELLLRINGISDARRLKANVDIKTLQGPFHVVVTKHAFTMDIYLGSPGEKGAQYITTFPVGLGREDSTPTGTWMVENRIPHPKYYSPRGEGVIEADDPKNPLGHYWIALTGTDGNAVGKLSYGIHGTIDPDSIGKMASMGCIRMRNEDVAIVYELLTSGKSIVVVNK
jgi:lipoprotein-anchoring transpeptidase ErfK/SrfK